MSVLKRTGETVAEPANASIGRTAGTRAPANGKSVTRRLLSASVVRREENSISFRRTSRDEISYDTLVVDDLAADNGQERSDAPEVLVGDCEVVSVEHGEIGMVANLNRADVVLPDEPLVGRRGE